jgi:hypothetical protein
MSTNFNGKFIADKKIKQVVSLDEKTYLGNDRIEVEFDDDTKTIYPKEVFEQIVSDESYDLTTLREKIVNPLIIKIISLLADYEITQEDTNYLLSRIPNILQGNLDKAIEKLFGKPEYKITMFDINKIIG